MYRGTFRYTPENVDCKYCAKYVRRRCVADKGCEYIAERIEAGVAAYADVVWATFKDVPVILRWRLRQLIERYDNTMWVSPNHEKRFRWLWSLLGVRRKRNTPQFFAVLYLLTANEDIYRRAYNAFCVDGFTPDYIRMFDISVPNYALVQAAKSIYLNTDHFTIADMCDCEAVNEEVFRLVVNAILIAVYGRDIMNIGRSQNV